MTNSIKVFGLAFIAVLVIGFGLVAAQSTDPSVLAGQAIVNSGVPCSQLNQTQLLLVGEYYMELIHPGAAHEYMDQMMGGDSSPMDQQMHLSLAEAYYCGNATGANASLAYLNTAYPAYGGMMGRPGYGMMGYGAYNPSVYSQAVPAAGGGMMGWNGWGYPPAFGWTGIICIVIGLLVIVVLALAAVYLYKKTTLINGTQGKEARHGRMNRN